MPRPRSVNPRSVVVAVRLTPREAAQVDLARGHLNRGEWLRWLLLKHQKG